jgi:Helix-loop-helix DNA-binding domain
LRSASKKGKRSPNWQPPTSDKQQRNRDRHNCVEKLYRNKLNVKFEKLLGVPDFRNFVVRKLGKALELNQEGNAELNKCQVLDLATEYIEEHLE